MANFKINEIFKAAGSAARKAAGSVEAKRAMGLWCYRKYIKPDEDREEIIKRIVLSNLERRTAFHKNTGHPWAHLLVTVNNFIFDNDKWYIRDPEDPNKVTPTDQGAVQSKTGIGSAWLNGNKKVLQYLLDKTFSSLDQDFSNDNEILQAVSEKAGRAPWVRLLAAGRPSGWLGSPPCWGCRAIGAPGTGYRRRR